jgi:pimeloyl-ACP methyl ester carboxylesterase
MAVYEAMSALWPAPHGSLDVLIRFGTTHVNASGPENASPILLLHAAGLSSPAWFANIGQLSRQHRVYGVDIIGDAGKSRPTRMLKSAADHALWLKEVLDALGLERVYLIGHSQGGRMALDIALAYPNRIKKLVLLASVSIYPFGLLTKLGLLQSRRKIRPSAESMLGFIAGKGAEFDQRFIGMMEMMTRHCLPTTMIPTVYSDPKLKRVAVPTLLLLAGQEKTYMPKAALRRATRPIAGLEAELVPYAGHTLPIEQPEYVNARILNFLEQ